MSLNSHAGYCPVCKRVITNDVSDSYQSIYVIARVICNHAVYLIYTTFRGLALHPSDIFLLHFILRSVAMLWFEIPLDQK
jgi:hypothetical protein